MLHYDAKKIVIIDNIDSKYIRQAVFILKEQEVAIPEDNVLKEAYSIVNSCETDVVKKAGQLGKVPLKHRIKRVFRALWFTR